MEKQTTASHPAAATALSLFDATATSKRLGNGHARENLRYAVARTAADGGDSRLTEAVNFWIKPQAREAILAWLRRTVTTARTSTAVTGIRQRVQNISELASRDEEAAHGAEDKLRTDVLTMIAEGTIDSKLLAAEALKTSEIEFGR